jgi:hypothetical protein
VSGYKVFVALIVSGLDFGSGSAGDKGFHGLLGNGEELVI